MRLLLILASLVLTAQTATAAKTFSMLSSVACEQRPDNKVWARSGKTCRPYALACTPFGMVKGSDEKCDACFVRYLTRKERAAYRLTWNRATEKWFYQGEPYDTEKENKKHGVKAQTKYDKEAQDKWGVMPGIWVVDPQGNLYASVEQSPGKFHHSTFLAGGAVRSAGQVVFKDGKITHINNVSGHYRPDADSLKSLLARLHTDTGTVVDYFVPSEEERAKGEPDRVDPKGLPDCMSIRGDPDYYPIQDYDAPVTPEVK